MSEDMVDAKELLNNLIKDVDYEMSEKEMLLLHTLQDEFDIYTPKDIRDMLEYKGRI